MCQLLYGLLLVPLGTGQPRAAIHPNCHLAPVSAATTLAAIRGRSAAARRAVRDFRRKVGSPYMCLYLKETAQSAEPICWLLVQQSATRFLRYTYRGQQVDSALITLTGGPAALASLPKGCYWPLCESISTSPVSRTLVVKQGNALRCGMSFEDDNSLSDYVIADQKRVAPVKNFIKLLNH